MKIKSYNLPFLTPSLDTESSLYGNSMNKEDLYCLVSLNSHESESCSILLPQLLLTHNYILYYPQDIF